MTSWGKNVGRISRRPWFPIAVVASVVVVIASILIILTRSSADETAVPVWLSILWAILGLSWAATGIASNFETIRSAGQRDLKRHELLAPVLVEGESFVDRYGQLEQLTQSLMKSKCVNCHGQRGAGKSHMLGYLADIVNGNLTEQDGRIFPGEYEAALYFDLADAAGFDKFVESACRTTFPGAESWHEFISRVESRFAGKRILLILDNVNLSSLWPAVGKASYEYIARRGEDSVILGSVDPVMFHNLSPAYVPIPTFDLAATAELARSQSSEVSDARVKDLFASSGGIPMFLRLILANEALPDVTTSELAIAQFLDAKVVPELDAETRDVVARLAVLSHTTRRTEIRQLQTPQVQNLDRCLRLAQARSLLTVTGNGQRRLVRMHDLVRDSLIQLLPNETKSQSNNLTQSLYSEGDFVAASIAALFGDPHHSTVDMATLFASVIETAVETRNYPYLETLWRGASTNPAVSQYFDDGGQRQALLAFARASQLAGSGQYAESESEILYLGKILNTPGLLSDDLAFELKFLLADVAHLQNRYTEALDTFGELRQDAIEVNHQVRIGRCEWAIGHSIRHQGRDLKIALEHFANAIEIARSEGQTGLEVLATADASAIRVFLSIADEQDRDSLRAMEDRLSTDLDRSADLIKLWKERARVEFACGFQNDATHILDRAMETALRNNDRLLFNLLFEQGEFHRILGELVPALKAYSEVAIAADRNGDRNLQANSSLGKAICTFLMEDDVVEDTLAEVRGTVLKARQVANEANILATVEAAEEIAQAMLVTDIETLRSVRLIVF